MKSYVAVLIAAVTVNCLVTAINGEAATDTLAVPYTDMLLPPLEDVQPDNSKDAAEVAKINVTAKVTPVTATNTSLTTTSTKKTITNEVNNILPELSIEALLPPLFEAKIEEEETKTITTTQKPTTTTTTTRRNPTTTTTKTTFKPSKIEVPELFLDALLPPLLVNDIDNNEDKVTITTQKPKTTKKSYYQQYTQLSKDLHLKDQKQQTASKEVKNYNRPSSDKHAVESKIQPKQVSVASIHNADKLHSKTEIMAHPHVAKQVAQQTQFDGNSKYEDKHYNYSFDFYLGSTTARPTKSGLPTITPFPHRLGR